MSNSTVTNVSSSTVTINDQIVKKWEDARTNAAAIKTIANASGNKFQFSFASTTDSIHVYLGVDANEILSVTVIPTNDDTIINTQCLGIHSISGSKETLSSFVPGTGNENAISWGVANTRINNWIDSVKRDAYIDASTASSSAPLVLAFYVDKMDFDFGDTHFGYLGLIETTIDGVTTYAADLTIYSEAEEAKYLEDLTVLVPPFKGGRVSDQANFGLYNRINP